MRKHLSIATAVLCVVAMAFASIGCGGSTGETKAISTSGAEKAETTVAQAGNAETASAEVTSIATTAGAVTIEEQVLLDAEGIVVTALEYEEDGLFGDSIKVRVENNTDKDVTVSCNALIVNNCMISDFFAATVAAGKKSNEKISLFTSELKEAGISTVGQVEIYFRAYDADTWADIIDNHYAVINTSQFDNMDITPNDDGEELYNEGGIRIVGKTVNENSFWGTGILFFVENSSGRNVGISVDDFSINGYMLNGYFSTTVYDGKMAIDELSVFESDLKDNNIESIEEVELKFRIYDADTFMTITESDVITFSAN